MSNFLRSMSDEDSEAHASDEAQLVTPSRPEPGRRRSARQARMSATSEGRSTSTSQTSALPTTRQAASAALSEPLGQAHTTSPVTPPARERHEVRQLVAAGSARRLIQRVPSTPQTPQTSQTAQRSPLASVHQTSQSTSAPYTPPYHRPHEAPASQDDRPSQPAPNYHESIKAMDVQAFNRNFPRQRGKNIIELEPSGVASTMRPRPALTHSEGGRDDAVVDVSSEDLSAASHFQNDDGNEANVGSEIMIASQDMRDADTYRSVNHSVTAQNESSDSMRRKLPDILRKLLVSLERSRIGMLAGHEQWLDKSLPTTPNEEQHDTAPDAGSDMSLRHKEDRLFQLMHDIEQGYETRRQVLGNRPGRFAYTLGALYLLLEGELVQQQIGRESQHQDDEGMLQAAYDAYEIVRDLTDQGARGHGYSHSLIEQCNDFVDKLIEGKDRETADASDTNHHRSTYSYESRHPRQGWQYVHAGRMTRGRSDMYQLRPEWKAT